MGDELVLRAGLGDVPKAFQSVPAYKIADLPVINRLAPRTEFLEMRVHGEVSEDWGRLEVNLVVAKPHSHEVLVAVEVDGSSLTQWSR